MPYRWSVEMLQPSLRACAPLLWHKRGLNRKLSLKTNSMLVYRMTIKLFDKCDRVFDLDYETENIFSLKQDFEGAPRDICFFCAFLISRKLPSYTRNLQLESNDAEYAIPYMQLMHFNIIYGFRKKSYGEKMHFNVFAINVFDIESYCVSSP